MLSFSLGTFDVYLGSTPFKIKVYTDHNPLTFLKTMKNKNQRLVRWSLALQEYNLEIQHIPGSENVVADALSRCIGKDVKISVKKSNTKPYNLNFSLWICIYRTMKWIINCEQLPVL